MSGLYLLLLFGVWLAVGWAIYRLWRLWHPMEFARRALRVVLGIALLMVWIGWPFWEVAGKKMYYDAKVRELCAKDGGTRVYERVMLPEENFNRSGQPNFYRPGEGENSLGPEYVFKEHIYHYRPSDPEVLREHQWVFRRSDEKLLGEGIIYIRRGGDLPGPWHHSWYTCPERGDMNLLEQIFVSAGEE